MKKISYIIGSMFIAVNAFAVDGYKDVKFGMSKEEVMQTNICTLKEDVAQSEEYIDVMSCDDLMFTGKHAESQFYFSDEKLLRIGIIMPVEKEDGYIYGDTLNSTLHALINKYGQPSSYPSDEELSALDSEPYSIADFVFDNETVILRGMIDDDYEQYMILIYTSDTYENIIIEKQSEAMSGDL